MPKSGETLVKLHAWVPWFCLFLVFVCVVVYFVTKIDLLEMIF